MYTRVVAGQDPTSNENGGPAAPSDISAYGCSPTSGYSVFLLGSSTADSAFLDEGMTKPVVRSASDSYDGAATTVSAGTTLYVPAGVSQARRFSSSNFPTTITARAAMPVLDLQCLTDGVNGDNADGAGWNNTSLAAGSSGYCILYVWDGIAAETPTATPSPTPSPTATPTTVSTTATLTVNFPGLSDTHVYAHKADGVPGAAGGAQSASSTWKSGSAVLTVPKGSYDVRVVHGPTTVILGGIDCSADCTATVPLATLTVNFPGLSDAHTYAHVSDGAPGTYGAQDSSSTWKSGSSTLVLLQAMYDVRVVHGPASVVLDNIDCRAATCSANVPLATLTVNFPGLSDAHSYVHMSDGLPGTYGAQDSSSTWKSNTTSLVILQGVYDVRVVHGPTAVVIDAVDCRAATCVADFPMAKLTVTFPELTDAHTYVHATDGATGSVGAQDSSSTWKSNSATFTLLRNVYDVRVVHGPTTVVLDSIDCRAETCSATAPLASLSVTFPGLTDAHTYVHATDGASGTYGAQDSSSTWKSNSTSFVLLQAIYDLRVVHGPAVTVLDAIDCRAEKCAAEVPLAALSVDFASHSNVHTYVRLDDRAASQAGGAAVTSSTWKTDSTSFVLLRGYYDVLIREGTTDLIVDAVDCSGPKCSASLADGVKPGTEKPTPTPAPVRANVLKSFVSENDGYVTWRIEPDGPADLFVWDSAIAKCEAFGGADCLDITSGGFGSFTSASKEQYLLVYQEFEKTGESCKVENTAEWSTTKDGKRGSVTAAYVCSGAPTMGWPMFAVFLGGAVAAAWVVKRKFEWSR